MATDAARTVLALPSNPTGRLPIVSLGGRPGDPTATPAFGELVPAIMANALLGTVAAPPGDAGAEPPSPGALRSQAASSPTPAVAGLSAPATGLPAGNAAVPGEPTSRLTVVEADVGAMAFEIASATPASPDRDDAGDRPDSGEAAAPTVTIAPDPGAQLTAAPLPMSMPGPVPAPTAQAMADVAPAGKAAAVVTNGSKNVKPGEPTWSDDVPDAGRAPHPTFAASGKAVTRASTPEASAMAPEPSLVVGGMAVPRVYQEPAAAETRTVSTETRVRASSFADDMKVAVGHQIAAGREEVTIRLDPPELGRIHVRVGFGSGGELRTVVATETTAALQLMRRNLDQLDLSLAQAGVRTDAQSFRFENPQSGGGGRQQRGDQHHRPGGHAASATKTADDVPLRRWRAHGQLDMIA